MEEIVEHSPSRRRLWWAVGGSAFALALVALAAVWFTGPRVWTDGATVRVAAADAQVRDVVWAPPVPLQGFSSDQQVYEPSISPDGTELYFVRGKAGQNAKIYLSLRTYNAWSAPAPLDAVNGAYDALGPRVTADGAFLLFYSNRPGGFGGYDIWAAPRTPDGWGAPFNLGPNVNSEFNEFNPDPAPDGRRIIFATNRKAARREQNEAWRSTIRETVSSDYDLWVADAAPAPPPAAPTTAETRPSTRPSEQLAFRPAREIPGLNTPYTEGASCMSPAGDFLYFASNRPGGRGKFDVYRARLRPGSSDDFGPAENVGAPINSAENEADPALAYNGFRMVFSSDRPGADGRYHLLATDSREVYPEHQPRPMPHLGWSWWVLIISLLALLPLLLMMRGWEDRRFSVLQKCLLMSLLVHALITFILSFVAVTQQVAQYVRHEIQLDVAVNLGDSRGVDETLAVRSQSTGDLPVSTPAPPSLQPTRVAAAEPLQAAAAPLAIDVPAATAAPAAAGGMLLSAPAPHTGVPAAPTEPLAKVTPSLGATPAIDVALPAPQRLAQSEQTPQPAVAPRASAERSATPAAGPTQPPAAVTGLQLPTDRATPAQTSTVAAASAPLAPAAAPTTGGPAPLPAVPAQPSGAAPEIATNGTLPRVTRAQADERAPAPSVARNVATTQPFATPAIADAPAGGKVERLELAASPAAGPSTQPSQAVAAARASTTIDLPQPSSADRPTADARAVTDPKLPTPALAAAATLTKLAGNVEAQPAAPAPTIPTGPVARAQAAPAPQSADVQVSQPASPAPPAGASRLSAAAPAKPSVASGPLQDAGVRVNPAVPTGVALAPDVAGPRPALASGLAKAAGADAPLAIGAPTPAASSARHTEGPAQVGAPRAIDLAPAPVVAAAKSAAGGKLGLTGTGGVPTARAQLAAAEIKPQVTLSALTGPLGPSKSVVPDIQFVRAPEQRKPMLEQFGGTPESEDAVARGLAYLARMQQSDGSWTYVSDDEAPRPRPRARGRNQHDMACTAFAVLAFLGHGDTPDRPGPYRDVVAKGVEFLIAQQDDDGDLRGPQRFRGGGSDSANMYDQGIATYALAESAIMTHDPRATEAATRAARFIVAAQDPRGGGWRYSPHEPGDSSVFGWQIMALHSAQQLGFEIPAETLDNAKRYIRSCEQGRHRLLAGYQPHGGPTPPMTAELVFSRMLLDLPLDDEGIDEVTRFLARDPPDPNRADLYYWYYASLSMLHMRNPLWKDWNVLTRESLIRMQQPDGPAAGSWDGNIKWADRGGRVFTTALATLTLEVYYRYLPLRKAPETQGTRDSR